MRKFLIGIGSAAALMTLMSTQGCQNTLHYPVAADAIKEVRVLEDPDPRTLDIHGNVMISAYVSDEDQERAEQIAIDELKRRALLDYQEMRDAPDTAVLFKVRLWPGHHTHMYHAQAIAAQRKES